MCPNIARRRTKKPRTRADSIAETVIRADGIGSILVFFVDGIFTPGPISTLLTSQRCRICMTTLRINMRRRAHHSFRT
jgi:hypothetical protein